MTIEQGQKGTDFLDFVASLEVADRKDVANMLASRCRLCFGKLPPLTYGTLCAKCAREARE